jgi:hypothetical protein
MRNFVVILMLLLGAGIAATIYGAPPDAPSWAFPVNPPGLEAAKDDGTLRHVPGSAQGLTLAQTRDAFNVPDWHPDGHPLMPQVVQHGRPPGVRACGYCHLPNGYGRPENASLAGLPAVSKEFRTQYGTSGRDDWHREGGR